jgi:hypothetical protein
MQHVAHRRSDPLPSPIPDDTTVTLEVRLLLPGKGEHTCFVACSYGNFRIGEFIAEVSRFLEAKVDPQ